MVATSSQVEAQFALSSRSWSVLAPTHSQIDRHDEWWKRDAEIAAVRGYFQVEDEAGERFWIYRSGDGEDGATGTQRWFLHGLFG